MNPQHPHDPKNPDAAWEEAMSRDFDARVRDLHEAPLDFTSVKGKARTIRRNRRAAVAGGILGVAAVITPIAVIMGGNDDTGSEPPFVTDPTPTETAADPTDGVDYLQGRSWHQADGDVVQLPAGSYGEAAIWNDQLVTLEAGLEVFSTIRIFDGNGDEVDEIGDAVGFAVSDDGSILAYTAGGDLYTRWGNAPDQEAVLAEDVTDTGGGESVGGAPESVTGTAPCVPESGSCLVRINTYEGGCEGKGSSDVPLPSGEQALICYDEQDGLLSARTSLDDFNVVCSGLFEDGALAWETCDHELQEISPDGKHVVGAPTEYDGLGYTSISTVDVETHEESGRYAPEGGFIWTEVAWTTSSQLLVSVYDGANWHLISINPDGGEITELADPVPADEVSNPWVLISH